MRNSTELTINLGHLAYNFDLLKKIAPKNQTILMVKANAYGHGMLQVVQFAFEDIGIKEFGCASLGEAMAIRKNLPKLNCELYVFSDTELSHEIYREQYVNYNINPVISNMEDLKAVLTDSNLKWLPISLKFDTGMNRLGISIAELDEVISLFKKYDRKEVHHLLTHFANSYIVLKDGDRTQRQYAEFLKLKGEFEKSNITIKNSSVANSGAIEQKLGLDQSHIRPGLMMYGPAGTGKSELWSGKTLSTFKTKVLKITSVKKGTPVGYGGHVCGQDGYIAHIPIGYGDGFLTYFSGGELRVNGESAKVLGRVNMDLTALFFENLPTHFKAGSQVIIWDDNENDISELSTQMKTIPYQLFTAITARVPRRYIK